MNELMMNLFSLIAGQVRNKQELFDNEGKIMQVLLNSGCRLHEADAALTLMQTLVQKQSESFFTTVQNAATVRMRAMNREERDRFTIDAFGFASKLAHLGIISDDEREDLLEKAMTINAGRIELDHIKNLIAFVLFVNPQEQEHSFAADLRRIKKTAWN
ncbi:MAG TPA: DUF494 family protein [Nitrospirota bacterium]|nr:DUF494 family protein [Nitrospirota bacterium]